VEKSANEHQLAAVSKIDLRIGAFSGVQADALLFALNALRRNTILSNAEIDIESPPLILYCQNCENEYLAKPDDLVCPGCLKADFKIIQGQEMFVKAIQGEVKTDER
jgi:hydrogenase nickel incorporation protein HypA/HybF